MAEPELFLDQRYYHVVAVGPNPAWDLPAAWRAIDRRGKGRLPDQHYKWGVVQHHTMAAAELFGRGAAPEILRGGAGEDQYDLFGVDVQVRRNRRYILFAVPFVQLGRGMTRALRDSGLLRDVEFVRLDLAQLVADVRKREARVAGLRISKIQMRIDDDPDLTGFAISGENALFSELYGRVMTEIGAKNTAIQHCSVGYSDETSGGVTVHCDSFGNFRMWLRKAAANAAALGGLARVLDSSGASLPSSTSPYFRATEEG